MSAIAWAGAARERCSSGAPSRAARYAAVAADCAVSITASPRAPDGCLRAAIPDDSGGRCPCGLLPPERRPTQACTSSPEATGVPGSSVRSSAISRARSQICNLGSFMWVNPKGARIANLGVLRRSGMGDRQLTNAAPDFRSECRGTLLCKCPGTITLVGVARSLVPRSVGSASLAEFRARSSTFRLDLLVQLRVCCLYWYTGNGGSLDWTLSSALQRAGAAWRCALAAHTGRRDVVPRAAQLQGDHGDAGVPAPHLD